MRVKLCIKNLKLCAFCKYWYDPTNEHIRPVAPATHFWEYETSAKCKCLKKNIETKGMGTCSQYVCKLP